MSHNMRVTCPYAVYSCPRCPLQLVCFRVAGSAVGAEQGRRVAEADQSQPRVCRVLAERLCSSAVAL